MNEKIDLQEVRWELETILNSTLKYELSYQDRLLLVQGDLHLLLLKLKKQGV